MSAPELARFSLKTLAGWLVLSLAAFAFQAPLAKFFLPFIDIALHLYSSDFAPALTLVEHDGELWITNQALALHPVAVYPGLAVPPGAEMPEKTHVTHTLVPPVLLLSLLLAWPTKRRFTRLLALSLGVALSLLIVAGTASCVLLGLAEISLQETAANAGQSRPEPVLLKVMIFLENGGRWLLAVVAAPVCARLAVALEARLGAAFAWIGKGMA